MVGLNETQAQVPITSSGLNTQVDLSSNPPPGKIQYDITGGTRPGNGPNLFHSFGEFGVPTNNIANFLNDSALPTNNILGRVTGGNISNIFGTIETTGFGNANLFLMNPAGFLFGPNATVNVGGMVAFTSADYLKLADDARFNAISNATADALLTASPVAAFGFLGANPGAITVQGSQFTVTEGTGISLVGGNITIQSGTPEGGATQPARLSSPNGNIQLASATSPGEFDATTLQPLPNVDGASFTSFGSVTLTPGSSVDVSGTNTVSIHGGQFVLSVNDAVLTTAVGPGDIDTIALSQGSSIVTTTSGVEPGADIEIIGKSLHMDGATIQSLTTGDGAGGNINITVTADNMNLTNGSIILSESDGTASGGNILVQGTNNVALQDGAFILSLTTGEGAGGNVTVTADSVNLTTGSSILSQSDGTQPGGNILVQATNVALTDGTILSSGNDGSSGLISISATDTLSITGTESQIYNATFGSGANSGIVIQTGQFLVNEAALTDLPQIGTESFNESGGNISIHATESATIIAGRITTFSTLAQAGLLEVSAPSFTINKGSSLSTRSAGPGNAGDLSLTATAGNLVLADGSHVRSSSEQGAGKAGTIIATAEDSIILSGGSTIESTSFRSGPAGSMTVSAENLVSLTGADTGLFSEAQGIGNGVGITIQANQMQITDGATISARTTDAGTGGDINIAASQSVTLTNGSSISASSSGLGDAGNIDITATNGFTMQNSTITTQAGQGASGGNIKVTTSPEATVLLTNSLISASVADGPGGGGNIFIDPQFVILQNSQILAQAAQGQGGTITITANLFLPDANSIVNADSGSGLHGTVTIQSPNAPASGKIQPLGKSPLQATSLLNQPCASLAGGEFSSFTVAGRDSLPTEPTSWLTSPLALATLSAGTGIAGRGEGLEGITLGASIVSETALLSLRQIAPAGFLTQAFALDWSAVCKS